MNMNRILIDADSTEQALTSTTSAQNMQKKARPKFTILDDIEQLNQIINGPGANQESQKAQQVLQKTYQYMKGHQSSVSTQNQLKIQKPQIQQQAQINQKDSRQIQNKQMDLKQNRRDAINIQTQGQEQKLGQHLKNIHNPKIIIALKKINLLKEPSPYQFYLKGLQKVIPYESNDGTRAPTNSMREDADEAKLFTKALQQKTERQKNLQVINSKQQRSDGQLRLKR